MNISHRHYAGRLCNCGAADRVSTAFNSYYQFSLTDRHFCHPQAAFALSGVPFHWLRLLLDG